MTVPSELPIPRDWQVFEDFCRDLFAAEWGYSETQKHGRTGQAQHGVDVFGRRDGQWQAVQCKRRSTFPERQLTEREIRAEVTAAEDFGHSVETLVIATTVPPDTQLQAVARDLTEEHGDQGPHVVVYGWSDLCEKLAHHDQLSRVWHHKLCEPTPSFSDDVSRGLSEALEDATLRHEELTTAGQDAAAALEEILDLKRRLRDGGHLKAGDILADGRFRLIELLGKGGFSSVFKAYDRRSCQLVAVKVLHGHHVHDRSRRERFFRGARQMAQLQHQGIVRVIEPELEDVGYHFFVMELAKGGDLHRAVLDGRTIGLEILRDVAEALDFAHRAGLVHRDVKPANILLTEDGRAKLTDFDLVRAFDTTGGTKTGSMLGTFLYASPEALQQAKDVDASTDIYSLGMTVTFVLHGEELPLTLLQDSAAFFDQLDAPPDVREALVDATSWKREERPATAVELIDTLDASAIETSTPAEPKPQGEDDASTDVTVSTPIDIERAMTPSDIERAMDAERDWEKRRKLIERVPESARDAAAALETLDRLRDRTRSGNDLFFLDQTIGAVAEKWTDAEQAAEQLRQRLFDHIPAPEEDLFQWIETRDGRVELWRNIPAGKFLMGSPQGEEGSYNDEKPQHEVVVRSPFRLAAVPVTIAQYAAFDPKHRSYHRGKVPDNRIASHPVETVTSYEAIAFCRWLSSRVPGFEGTRLPTEAEWEYACRAGTQTRYWKGDDDSDLEAVGWYDDNSDDRTHRGGRKPANAWGLYDVHGNVWEWTASEWTADYSGIEIDPSRYTGAEARHARAELTGALRVYRGGSCWYEARSARSACRNWREPRHGLQNHGFRVLRPAARASRS